MPLVHYVFYEPIRERLGAMLCTRGNPVPTRYADGEQATCLRCIAIAGSSNDSEVGILYRLLKQGWELRPARVA
jgi:hypothetical protein